MTGKPSPTPLLAFSGSLAGAGQGLKTDCRLSRQNPQDWAESCLETCFGLLASTELLVRSKQTLSGYGDYADTGLGNNKTETGILIPEQFAREKG